MLELSFNKLREVPTIEHSNCRNLKYLYVNYNYICQSIVAKLNNNNLDLNVVDHFIDELNNNN